MMTADRLCAYIVRLLQAPVRIYDPGGEKLRMYMGGGEQQDVLDLDRELLSALLEKGREMNPALHLEANEVIYSVISSRDSVYIMGPCCLSRDPVSAATSLVKRHRMDPVRPYRLPRVPLYCFEEYTAMLFEALTGGTVEIEELSLRCFCDGPFEQALNEKVHRVFHSLHETAAAHNPYSQEAREQENIRTGNLEGLYKSFQESCAGAVGKLSPDPLRHAQNLAIVLITLASRSAIAGGLLPETAFSMSDAFIQRTEELRNVGEAVAIGRQAEVAYCTAVRDLRDSTSALVARCKTLVHQRLYTKLTVKDLARELGVTSSYLSEKFIQEEGIRLKSYIAREKVEAAKDQLVYSQSTYEAVAFSLAFSSQSHFGQTFKRWTGLTPKEYREAYGGG